MNKVDNKYISVKSNFILSQETVYCVKNKRAAFYLAPISSMPDRNLTSKHDFFIFSQINTAGRINLFQITLINQLLYTSHP